MNRKKDTIFLIGDDGALHRAPQRDYDSESVLQTLIADYPDILAGDQMNPDDPPKWLLIRREADIPGDESGSNRWAVDHLLLDQNAIPTFVEVKRSTDSRIRREVVGQMLDYAANAQKYWPQDRIRALAIAQAGGEEKLNSRLIDLLQEAEENAAESIEAFWGTVHENLRAGRVRLLFVADELPAELRRIIEFLNEQMPRVDVLGVEIRQYKSGAVRALVPRIIGQTELTRQEKQRPKTTTRQLTRDEFLAGCPPQAREFFERVLDEAEAKGLIVAWGTQAFSIRFLMPNNEIATLLYGYLPNTNNPDWPTFDVYLGYLQDFDTKSLRAKLVEVCGLAERGKHTLRLVLDEEGLQRAPSALTEAWKATTELQEGRLSG